MADGSDAQLAKDRAESIPLDEIDVSDPELWRNGRRWPYFERLRREAPVHLCRTSDMSAETYLHLARQHRSIWTRELDLRAFSDLAWWNHEQRPRSTHLSKDQSNDPGWAQN